MNVIDMIILGILGVSVLVGFYRGFVSSVASLGGCVLSLGLSFWLNPKLVEWVRSNEVLTATLTSYTDAATRIGDQALAGQPVSALTPGSISAILERVNLPAPLSALLQSSLEHPASGAVQTLDVGSYVSQAIVGAVLNVICFVVCFIACMLVIHFVLNFLKAVFRFPVLKQMNAFVGGVFGLLRGALLCFVAFALLPLIQTAVPIEGIGEMVAGSTLAPLFNSQQLILAIMNGHL